MTSAWVTLPTRHAPECLDAPVHVTLTLQHSGAGIFDSLSLPAKICQGACTDSLGLIRKRLAGLQSLRASIKTVRPREQLLSLLHVNVGRARGVICVSRSEEGRAIGGEGGQLATSGICV